MAISFETERLKVTEISRNLASLERSSLLKLIPNILTPQVVKNLPPYFQGITSSELAACWLERMLLESRLFKLKSKTNQLIGFLFIYVENEDDVHIGYLFGEGYWGKGLASELLQSFVVEVAKIEPWSKLTGGVDASNVSSIKVLKKSGFVESSINESGVVFYEYVIPRS